MSTLPPLPLVNGCLFIDNSGFMEGASTCDRLLEYRFLHQRIPAGDRVALNFGSSQHLGLEYRYVKYQNKAVDASYYNDLGTLLSEFFGEHPVPTDDWRTLNWSMELLRKQNERRAIEEFNLLSYDTPIDCPQCRNKEPKIATCLWCSSTGKRSVMVELPFGLPLYTHKSALGEIPVIYTGRIDLPVSVDGEIYVMDHKTTSMMGQSFFDDIRMSSQQKGYVWAFEQLCKRPVKGYFVNAIRTKEPPQYVLDPTKARKGSTTTPAQWWQESLQREKFITRPGDSDEWFANTVDIVEEFFWHYQRDYMPMKTKLHCTAYGKCSYYEVCRLVKPDRGIMLASGMFTNNTWSPLQQPE